MEGVEGCTTKDVVPLDLSCPHSLSIDASETSESKIQRLIAEHPVVIFRRHFCCMSGVMRSLLATVGVHPAVIELDDHEIECIPRAEESLRAHPTPTVFIGGDCIGGFESLVALHLSGKLVPKLTQVGALYL